MDWKTVPIKDQMSDERENRIFVFLYKILLKKAAKYTAGRV